MPFHNPFGVLSGLGSGGGDSLAPKPTPKTDTAVEPDAARAPKGPARAVVRIERAGRRGKGVTVIEHLQLGPAQLAEWLKQLKAALGCGGAVEGDAIVLQGDQRSRLPALLASRGVKKITVA